MLVVGPNSTCDICLESYTSGANVPHAISCGHVFCLKCLDHLMQHKCPLCRERFSPRDIRKLHVECDSTAIDSHPTEVAPRVDNEAQRLLDDIARIVKEGAKVNEIRRVIEDCRTYYKSQPGNQYTPVRVGALLLHSLMEGQRKLGLQAEQLREITATRDEIRDRLTSELHAAEIKYRDLERTSRDEKETALAVEKSLREHYDQMNSFWKTQLESAHRECRDLRDELARALSSHTTVPSSRNTEFKHFYGPEPKRASENDEGSLSQMETPKGKFVDDDYDFHLSPLAEADAPLASTAPSLLALTDDFDPEDVMKVKRTKSPVREEFEPDSELEDYGTSAAPIYPFPAHLQPQPEKVDPIPIPSRTPPSRQSSTMATSITADQWPSGVSSSKSRDDVVMSSQPPSPGRRSGDRQSIPQAPRPKESFTREMTELKRRDSIELPSKDRLVSKLYDILDSPRPPSTLHGHMQQRSDFPEPTLPRATSRLTAPSRPSSATQSHHSSSASLAHYPDDHYNVPPPDRKPLVRASDVAMQLEKERLERLEKERRRMRETPPAPSPAPPALTNSLKDATNVPVDAHYLNRHKSASGKTKATYPATADTYT